MRIFVSALCVVCAWLAVADPASAQGTSFGVKGGLVGTTLATSGAGEFETEADAGLAVGLFAAFVLGDRVRVQPEALFALRRFSATGAPSFSVEARALEVPVLLWLHLAPERRVRPVLFAGPQVSVVSKVTQSTSLGDTDISDQIEDVDVGVTVGAGVEVAAGRGAITIDGRVNIGVKDLSVDTENVYKSRAFQLLVGYRF